MLQIIAIIKKAHDRGYFRHTCYRFHYSHWPGCNKCYL